METAGATRGAALGSDITTFGSVLSCSPQLPVSKVSSVWTSYFLQLLWENQRSPCKSSSPEGIYGPTAAEQGAVSLVRSYSPGRRKLCFSLSGMPV